MIANQETKSLPSQIILLANIIDGLPHDASLKSLVKNKWRQSSYSPSRSSTPVSCNEKEFTQFDCFTVPHYYETVNTPEYGVSLDFPADLTPNEPFLTEENYLIPNYSEKDTTKTTFAKSDRNKQCANELLNGTLGNATDSKTSSTPSQKDTDGGSHVETDGNKLSKVRRRSKCSKRKVCSDTKSPKIESTEKGQEKEFVSIKDLNIDLIGSVFPKGSIIFINNLSREKAKFANFEQRNVTCSTDVSKSKNLTVPESNYCSKQEHDAILFNLESLQIKYNALFCFVNRFEEHTKFSCDQLERFIETKKYCILMITRLKSELGDDYTSVLEHIYNCNNVSEIKSWADILFGIHGMYGNKPRRKVVQSLLKLYNVNTGKADEVD